MKVLLIYSAVGGSRAGTRYAESFAAERRRLGDDLELIDLAGRNIASCIGCYRCWLKTPGICTFSDDEVEILKGFVRADQVIWLATLRMGFVPAIMKNAQDRLIPLIHPFLRMNGDRMGHVQRYESIPQNILLIEPEDDSADAELEILRGVYRGYTLVDTAHEKAEESAYATHHL